MRDVSRALLAEYRVRCEQASDINEHLPILYTYALQCDLIVELGVRDVVSTWAFLAAKPKALLSIDIEPCLVEKAAALADSNGISFRFLLADDLSIVLDPMDLLFIDTLHNYEHLTKELNLHADKARKWIILHDTTSCGEIGMPANHINARVGIKGIWPAIEEFLAAHREWRLVERRTNNNGLTILARDIS